MTRDRTVASGSTIEGGGAMLVSPSRVPETGSDTGRVSAKWQRLSPTPASTSFILRHFEPALLAERCLANWLGKTSHPRLRTPPSNQHLTMLAPRTLPQEYVAWNEKYRAPFGARWWRRLLGSRRFGRFAHAMAPGALAWRKRLSLPLTMM